MFVIKIASLLGAVFHYIGGITAFILLGEILAQQTNGVSLDPALVAAYGAIGALFSLLTWMVKGRIERCEKREDTLLTADSDKTATMRELATVVSKAADLASSAVTVANAGLEETKRNGSKLERIEAVEAAVIPDVRDIKATVNDLSRRFDDLSRRIDSALPR